MSRVSATPDDPLSVPAPDLDPTPCSPRSRRTGAWPATSRPCTGSGTATSASTPGRAPPAQGAQPGRSRGGRSTCSARRCATCGRWRRTCRCPPSYRPATDGLGAADRPRRPPLVRVGADLAGGPAPRARRARRGPPARVGAHERPPRAGAARLRPPGRDPSPTWDIKRLPQLRPWLPAVAADRRPAIEAVLDRFDEQVAPVLPRLRAQVVHNDLAPTNVLVDDRPGPHGHHRLRRHDPHRAGLRPGGRGGRRAQRARGRARAGAARWSPATTPSPRSSRRSSPSSPT